MDAPSTRNATGSSTLGSLLRELHDRALGATDERAAIDVALELLATSLGLEFVAVRASVRQGSGLQAVGRPPDGLEELADTTRVAIDAAVVDEILLPADVADTVVACAEAAGAVLDGCLHLIRIEQDLGERVKELRTLREVQLAIEDAAELDDFYQRIAASLATGMQFSDRARVELHLDGHTTVTGSSAPMVVRIGADIVVDGVVRGDVVVGYDQALPLLEPEERNLVHAVARSLSLHVGARDARTHAEAAEERLQRVLDGLPSAVFAVTPDLNVEVITLAEAFPMRQHEGSLGSLEDWDDPTRERVTAMATQALGGAQVRDELPWRDRWWDVRFEPQYTDDGTVERALVMLLDITDQVRRRQLEAEAERARTALRDSQREFEAIADAIDDVAYRIVLSPEPQIVYVSSNAERVLGVEAGDLLGAPDRLRDAMHPDDRVRMDAFLRHPTGLTGVFRWRWRHPDGHDIWLEDRRKVLTRDGQPVSLVGVVRDVTQEQHQVEQTRAALEQERRFADELRRIDQMKTTFLSAVSHELRTPLTGVLGFAETARRVVSERAPETVEHLDRLVDNARRLERLVDDLLDVDRLTRGTIEPRRAPTDLEALVRDLADRSGHVSVHEVHLDVEPVDADVDAGMIERVVDNLLRNAERHTPPGSSVWVRLRRSGSDVVLVVEDDGPGIPRALRERIFEPFEQGSSSASASSPGTGIGLSLVRRFVEVHGGQVVLDDRPGGGARFTATLPRHDPTRDADDLRN